MMQGLITSIDGHCCPDLISPALICQHRASRPGWLPNQAGRRGTMPMGDGVTCWFKCVEIIEPFDQLWGKINGTQRWTPATLSP
jgi:hypothetical protein